ncbi:hypothetical protein DPMN_116074 [Dreissena polymorpha]|uniref:Uncharacterized protein n=1 Tax=Dreissena polymorpha TaxID=45954 RepID=A0A9D4KNP8_DREPO|nr:hypothetical protein DPMN_116074 [Dreissena polymorpha]
MPPILKPSMQMSNDTTAFCVRFFVAAFCYGLTNASNLKAFNADVQRHHCILCVLLCSCICYGLTNAYQGFRRQHFRDEFIVQVFILCKISF